jgi:hypothetical protein
VIGVDETVGPVIESALDQQLKAGWLTDAERGKYPWFMRKKIPGWDGFTISFTTCE